MKTMEILGKSPGLSRARPSREFVIPDCRIGLEYEYENTNTMDIRSWQELQHYFSAHPDGSLRKSGQEFVFTNPLFGENLLAAITLMDDTARACKFENSYRTSMHVHLDMEGTEFPHAPVAYGCLYAVVEPLMYRFVGNKREFNNYCLPWHQSEQHFELFLDRIPTTDLPQGSPHLKILVENLKRNKVYKYAGMNFWSLGDFGTVEWRHAPVGMSKVKVIQWINLIQSLKLFIDHRKVPSPRDIMEEAYDLGAEAFLKKVYGENYVNAIRYSPDVGQDFNLGLKTGAQYVVSCAQRGII